MNFFFFYYDYTYFKFYTETNREIFSNLKTHATELEIYWSVLCDTCITTYEDEWVKYILNRIMPYDIIHFYKHKASKEFAFFTNAVNESAHDFNNRSKYISVTDCY